MPKSWPKHMRQLARVGREADGVILRFVQDTTSEGAHAMFAVVRWLDPEGRPHETQAGGTFGSDPRGRGDVMRAMFELEERPWYKPGDVVDLGLDPRHRRAREGADGAYGGRCRAKGAVRA